MSGLVEASFSCPYCGEANYVLLETLEEAQEYIEDCQVCCQPIVFHVSPLSDGSAAVDVHGENDTW